MVDAGNGVAREVPLACSALCLSYSMSVFGAGGHTSAAVNGSARLRCRLRCRRLALGGVQGVRAQPGPPAPCRD
jgi:hypothetical protein